MQSLNPTNRPVNTMNFDFPEIDEMPPSSHTSQPASMHNLLNANSQTPVFSQPMAWNSANPSHDLPPLPLHPPQQANKRRAPLPETRPQQPPPPPPSEPARVGFEESPPIDTDVVAQMGGLGYADMCKERAREQFKEMKKNEHLANGDYDRIRRRKKNDTSMSARQRYVRRLRMNQDSAAAARHAQEVYVQVLEKLVRTSEDEKKVAAMEVAQFRQEVAHLRQQNASLKERLSVVGGAQQNGTNQESNPLYDNAGDRSYDPFLVAKFVDMLITPEKVSAQAQDRDFAEGRMGIQPSRAV